MVSDISIKDFYPINNWIKNIEGENWSSTYEPRNIIDETTGREYWNETKGCVRFKCFLLSVGTPFAQTIASIINIAVRTLALVTLFHFWVYKPSEREYSLLGRLQDAGKNLGKILFSPLAILALELSALYGIISPYNGRKLYASFERLQYKGPVMAPCFQPEATHHFFGGDPNRRNAF